jgi:transposase InsO family protein
MPRQGVSGQASPSTSRPGWSTLTYIDWFNNRRIHNEAGKIPPAELEQAYYRQIVPAELATS